MSNTARERLTEQAWGIITRLEETGCETEDYSALLRNLEHLLSVMSYAADILDNAVPKKTTLKTACAPDDEAEIRPGPVLVQSAAEAEPVPVVEPPRFKFVAVRGALSDARAKNGVDVVGILDAMGCKGLSDVPVERYGELLERAGIDPDTVEKEG